MTGDLEQDLRRVMRGATDGVTLRPDAAALARAKARRRRRNRFATAALVAVLVAVGVPVAMLAGPSSDTTRLVPAGSTPTRAPAPTPSPESSPGPGRTVGGVDPTWIPPGLRFEQSSLSAGLVAPGGVDYRADYLRGGASDRVVFLAVTASWGPPTTLDALRANLHRTNSTADVTRTTVRGHPALLAVNRPKQEFSLLWIERTGLVMDIGGDSASIQPQATRIAAGLVVRGQPPLDPAVDAAVRTAYSRAFSAGVPAAVALAAIEDGPAIATARSRFLASRPDLARTVGVTVGSVASTDPTHAVVGFRLTFHDPAFAARLPGLIDTTAGGLSTYDASGRAVRTPSGWKVSQATVCATIIPNCLPTPH